MNSPGAVTKAQNDSAGCQQNTAGTLLDELVQEFPSASAFWAALEKCSGCLDYWESKSPGQVQSSLDRWIRLGRPETAWPESYPPARRPSHNASAPKP